MRLPLLHRPVYVCALNPGAARERTLRSIARNRPAFLHCAGYMIAASAGGLRRQRSSNSGDGDCAGLDGIASDSTCTYAGSHEPSRPLLRGRIIGQGNACRSQCLNRPRAPSLAVPEHSIRRAGYRFKPLVFEDFQTAADTWMPIASSSTKERPPRQAGAKQRGTSHFLLNHNGGMGGDSPSKCAYRQASC